MPAATPPAVVTIGDLYVDVQSRALWLGVDPSVDPAGSIIVSDYNYTFEVIAAALVTAGAYTDAQVATRAPLAHTHVHGDITDFNAAVLSVIASSPSTSFPSGGIILWSGSIVDIGVGPLANWALCDGTNGTPDLRDRFVMGAGNVAAGSLNPNATAVTTSDGAHTPIVQGTSLSVAQTPAHSHTFSGSDSFASSTGLAGTHNHVITGVLDGGGTVDALVRTSNGNGGSSVSFPVSTVASHQHTFSGSVTIAGTTSSQGAGAMHSHIADAVPAHNHTISSANLRAALPYYALAYIMKL